MIMTSIFITHTTSQSNYFESPLILMNYLIYSIYSAIIFVRYLSFQVSLYSNLFLIIEPFILNHESISIS